MDEQDNNRARRQTRDGGGEQRDFSAAMSRLEQAVQGLVDVTTEELSERATSLIDDTSRRIESELKVRRASKDSPDLEQRFERRRRRHRLRHRFEERRERFVRRGAFFQDPHDRKIAGVCAAVARYSGTETWIVRLGALTGLFFLPGIVFPAYWILYFIMDKSPRTDDETVNHEPRRPRRDRRAGAPAADEAADAKPAGRARRYPVAGPTDTNANASRRLRFTVSDITQAELRLRRLESFVTSKQYELHKELHKIEREAGSNP